MTPEAAQDLQAYLNLFGKDADEEQNQQTDMKEQKLRDLIQEEIKSVLKEAQRSGGVTVEVIVGATDHRDADKVKEIVDDALMSSGFSEYSHSEIIDGGRRVMAQFGSDVSEREIRTYFASKLLEMGIPPMALRIN